MPIPIAPKIYHIVHVDRLASIVADGCLWCDAEMNRRKPVGTTIGMDDIKRRRLYKLRLNSHPGLFVGDCVPFYFCPRSVMLYLIYKRNHEGLTYRGGQEPIIHFEADLRQTVAWATSHGQRWAFTLSNAGAYYFEDRCDLDRLEEIQWDAVRATNFQAPAVKEGKQAEFLLEFQFPWELVTRIGVLSKPVYSQVLNTVQHLAHQPSVRVIPDWYYG